MKGRFMNRHYYSWALGGLSFLPLVGALAEWGIFPNRRWFGLALCTAVFFALLTPLIAVYADLRDESQSGHKAGNDV
jgi:hypothetical protein